MTENTLQEIFSAEEALRRELTSEDERLQVWLESVRAEVAAACNRREEELQRATAAELQRAEMAATAAGERLLAAARRRCDWLAGCADADLRRILAAELPRLLPGRGP